MIQKILNLKPGTAVTRQYRNAKKVRAFSAANAVVACSLGFSHAKRHSNIVFIDMLNILIFGKLIEKSHAIMKNLQPEYNQIVKRAKSIIAVRKNK